jgi:hypothetical protein
MVVRLHAEAQIDIYSLPYSESNQSHLYEKFDYFSDTERMDCNSFHAPIQCRFDIKHDAHLGMIITILLVALFLMIGLIGRNPDYDGDYEAGVTILSEKKKNEINARPIYLGWAILVFVIALYAVKYIRKNDTNKIINFSKQTLLLEDRDGNYIQRYDLNQLKAIEVLRYTDSDYQHYELNLQFENSRINLYAGKDDLSCHIQARELHSYLKKPVVKIKTGK